MAGNSSIRMAQSVAVDARQAVEEFHATVVQPDMSLVLFFCSSEYDLDVLAVEMDRVFPGVQVIGCTTAGEIGPSGYLTHSLCGVSFGATDFAATSVHIEKLQQFQMTMAPDLVGDLMRRLERDKPHVQAAGCFAILLIDGLSVREETVTWSLQRALGEVPMVGGSAGDDMHFKRTQVFAGGRFRDDSAVLLLVSPRLPFKTFKTQHFVPTEKRLVITAADSARRIVTEIDGLPAAEGYARLLGIHAQDLDPDNFADAPVVVLIDSLNYVRSIQKANPDGTLTFYCAIDEGLVLRLARGVDLVENLELAFADIRAQIGPPQLVICFDCILRRLEIVHRGLQKTVADVFQLNNAVGFNSYGEQFHDVHVNQTLTGIAIGSARAGKADGR